MSDLILYDLVASKWLIISFLAILFISGCTVYFLINNFSLKKRRIKLYGLLLELSDKDILILSVIIIRTFVIIYYLLIPQQNITTSLFMIGMISVIYIILTFNNVIYETINTIALIAVVYFADILNNYLTQVTYSSSVQIIKISLIAFSIMYTVYILFRGIENIVTDNTNIND